MFEKLWVRFLLGTQMFSLSRARVMLSNSPFANEIYCFLTINELFTALKAKLKDLFTTVSR